MDFLQLLRSVFALAVVLGLILGLAYVLRRYAPNILAQLQSKRGEKRLQVLETLVLDPARRLVLVKLDDEERLILLGEGHELIEPRAAGAARPKPKPVLTSVPTYDSAPQSSKPKSVNASKARDPNDDLF